MALNQHSCELKFTRKAITVSILFGISIQVAAQPIDPSCADVGKAIDLLRTQPWVLVNGTVSQGVHPELYTSMTSALLDRRRQIRILDGERFSSPIDSNDRQTMDGIIGALELHPDTPCERIQFDTPPQNESLVEYTYSTKVTRADAHFRVWISRSSGLPVKIQIDGPQLIYRRSLSRPSKPPQVVLWPNGQRYEETRHYIYGQGQVSRWLADHRIQNR
jgi:hypothetical protein